MRRALSPALCVLATLTFASAIHADILPGPGPRRPVVPPSGKVPPPKPIAPAIGVQMRGAEVDVQLRYIKPADIEKLNADAKLASQQVAHWVIADVTCTFDMFYEQAKTPASKFYMAFPVRSLADPNCIVVDFQVKLDGNDVPKVEPLDRVTISPAVNSIVYAGYQWPAAGAKGATQKITVTYRLLLPFRAGAAFFRYVLRSGALWAGPIGKETVTVKAAADLAVKPVAARTLKPTQTDSAWRWELTDVRPTEDIELTVQDAPSPKGPELRKNKG